MKTPTVITALRAVELGRMPAPHPLLNFKLEASPPPVAAGTPDLVELRLTSQFGCTQVVRDTEEARALVLLYMAEALRLELYGDVIAELRKMAIGLRRNPSTAMLPEVMKLEGIIRALSGEGE